MNLHPDIAAVLEGRSQWAVVHGDSTKILSGIRGIACVVCDPPYGISHKCNFKSRGRGGLAECNDYPDVAGDDKPFDPSWILDLDVPTVLWGANHYADKLPPTGGWLVWDKERPDTLDQATCELAWTNCVKGVRRFRHLWNGMMRASEHGENYHPTQKPVALFDWVFSLRWMPKSGVVLDPYCGSGPAGVAATKASMGYIGCDLSDRYVNVARQRIRELSISAPAEDRGPALFDN